MKTVELNKGNKESIDLSGKDELLSFMDSDFNDDNAIFSCIVGLDNDEVKNYCIYTGVKDIKLVQMTIENLSSKKFLEESISYAFNKLDAYTITIFTDKQNKLLEDEGFEDLGNDNNVFTYIKEKEMDKEVGRVRI